MRKLALTLTIALLPCVAAASASAATKFERLPGFRSPGTPAKYNKVGILKVGPRNAPNVLVLNPGTSASAAYFAPLAKDVVTRAKGWQVWAVERRENLLEDQSVFDKAKAGKATPQQVFDYYLGWLNDPSITNHFQLIPDADVAFAREWGMRVEIEDLRRVVKRRQAAAAARSCSAATRSAARSRPPTRPGTSTASPGASGLSGLVYIDGGSGPTPVTRRRGARGAAGPRRPARPGSTFGGIAAPFTGLFNTSGALGVLTAPDAPSIGRAWPLLPANLKPPVPRRRTRASTATRSTPRPRRPGLVAAQAHLGRLAASGDPRGWERRRRADADQALRDDVLGLGPEGPRRHRLVPPAAADDRLGRRRGRATANPAQAVLDVRATHGDDLPKRPADLRVRRGAGRPARARRGERPREAVAASRSAA